MPATHRRCGLRSDHGRLTSRITARLQAAQPPRHPPSPPRCPVPTTLASTPPPRHQPRLPAPALPLPPCHPRRTCPCSTPGRPTSLCGMALTVSAHQLSRSGWRICSPTRPHTFSRRTIARRPSREQGPSGSPPVARAFPHDHHCRFPALRPSPGRIPTITENTPEGRRARPLTRFRTKNHADASPGGIQYSDICVLHVADLRLRLSHRFYNKAQRRIRTEPSG